MHVISKIPLILDFSGHMDVVIAHEIYERSSHSTSVSSRKIILLITTFYMLF